MRWGAVLEEAQAEEVGGSGVWIGAAFAFLLLVVGGWYVMQSRVQTDVVSAANKKIELTCVDEDDTESIETMTAKGWQPITGGFEDESSSGKKCFKNVR